VGSGPVTGPGERSLPAGRRRAAVRNEAEVAQGNGLTEVTVAQGNGTARNSSG
jgi:hypothetical protein